MEQVVWTGEMVSRLWNNLANQSKENYFAFHSGKSLVKHCSKKLDFEGKVVLDFGCGNGYMYEWLKIHGIEKYIGVDFSEESVDYIKSNYQDDARVKGVLINDLSKEVASNSVDIILVTEVIEHLYDDVLEADIEIWKSVLKTDGRIILSTPNAEQLEKNYVYCPCCDNYFHKWQHVRSWNRQLVHDFFDKHELETIFCEETMLRDINENIFYYMCLL